MSIKIFLPVACCLLPVASFPQLPDTDIWLFDLKDSSGFLSVSNGVNITNRPGYDNQPSFSPDGSYVLYTSIRDKQADIYKYDLKKKNITQLCNTEESEYSPMVAPDKKSISVVRVEKDSAQRIWKFPVKGKPEFSLVMDKIDSVGYYWWYNKDSMAMFILTEPFSLQLVNIHKQEPKIIALNIGRCFRWSKMGPLYYFQRNTFGKGTEAVMTYFKDEKESGAAIVLNSLVGSEDYVVLSTELFVGKGRIDNFIMAKDSELFFASSIYLDKGWIKFANLEKYNITKITRIAISPDQKRIAIVSNK